MNSIEKIRAIREDALNKIKEVVKSFKDQRISLGECCYDNCPVLRYADDDEDIFTLDTIRLENGVLYFDGSSSWNNDTWSEDTIGTDELIGIEEEIDAIADWCKDYEEEECE